MNNKQLNLVLSIVAAALCGGFCLAQAAPMGTAFTYQGRLVTTDGPANGNYELKFSLYDAVSDGAQVGATQGPLALSVTGGLFTVFLDFGPVFQGDLRYLEIMARTNAGPTWTTLPRQPLTPAPNALFASKAAQAGQATQLMVPGNGYLGTGATISGGQNNTNQGLLATIGGGDRNTVGVIGTSATIGGGVLNTCTSQNTTVGGGGGNTSSALGATVSGGQINTSSGGGSTVGGGLGNTASGSDSTVGGGNSSTASGSSSTVGGGGANLSSGNYATVSGGYHSEAVGNYSTVGGGIQNTNIGRAATIPGGELNAAAGDYAFAAGRQAKANHQGAFVWADAQGIDFASTASNQFLIRASGGVGIGTPSPEVALHVVSDGYYAGLVESSHTAGTSFVLRSHPPGVAKLEWSLNMQPADDPYGHAGSLYFLSGGNTVPPTATPLVLAMNGNVGIGMDPTVRLDVNGDIKANSKSVAVGEESLRIVRGVVDWNGNVYTGSGFTSTKVGTGAYKVTFTTAFTGLPVVTATAEVPSGTGLDMIACMIMTNTASAVTIGTRGTTGAGFDRRFHFIAIGPR